MGGSPPPQQESALVAFVRHLFSGTNSDTIIPAAIIVGAVIVAVLTRQSFPAWAVVTFGVIIAILTLVPQYQNFVTNNYEYRLQSDAQQNQNFMAVNINVLDQETDNPVENAQVALLVAQRVYASSNSNGLAVLSIPGASVKAGQKYEMIVNHPNYERVKKEVALSDGYSDWVRMAPVAGGDTTDDATTSTAPAENVLLRGVPLNAFPPESSSPSNRQLYNDVVDFITPYVQSTGTRRSLVLEAFWDEAIVNRVDYSGSPADFASHLVDTARTYDDNEAIIRLLQALRNDVGTNKQAELDGLIQRLRA
ncbi:MAG: hypothetical protein AAFR22_16590 [Chloroflexota bacterium]